MHQPPSPEASLPPSCSAGGTSLLDAYARAASEWPDRLAMIGPIESVSFGDLWQMILNISKQAHALGLGPSDRIVLAAAPGSIGWLAGLLGILASGAEAIQPDPSWSRQQRSSLLAAVQPTASLGESGLERTRSREKPWQENHAGGGIWLFTSGTTAQPRPRLRTSDSLAAMLLRVHGRIPATLSSGNPVRCFSMAPIYHGFGLLNAVLLMHKLGATLHLVHDLPPERILEDIRRHEPAMLYGWPEHFTGLLGTRHAGTHAAHGLAWCVSSACRLPHDVASRFLQRFGCPLRQQYGTTETGPISLDSEQPCANLADCVGTPLAGVGVRILDHAGRELPAGSLGLIGVSLQGGQVPELPELAGYHLPGDLGWKDGTGRLFIAKRNSPFYDERQEVT